MDSHSLLIATFNKMKIQSQIQIRMFVQHFGWLQTAHDDAGTGTTMAATLKAELPAQTQKSRLEWC